MREVFTRFAAEPADQATQATQAQDVVDAIRHATTDRAAAMRIAAGADAVALFKG